jgi:nucleotide-binding universal stress UspA family protein
MKKEKILITPGHYESPNSTVNFGVQLAKKLARPAFLFGVKKPPVKMNSSSIMDSGTLTPNSIKINQAKIQAEQKLKSLYLEAKMMYPHVEYQIEIGYPIQNIISKSENEVPYLVVLQGNNELSTLHEWFSTYETRLAENIEAPVLVLPQEYYWHPVHLITYFMDMNDHQVENMRVLSRLAKDLNAKIAVVMLFENDDEEEVEKYKQTINILRDFLGYHQVTFHQVFPDDTSNSVGQLMEHLQADWLVFEHQSRSFLERMLDTYHTKRLILQSGIPVLVF